jgi:hypothetical protein
MPRMMRVPQPASSAGPSRHFNKAAALIPRMMAYYPQAAVPSTKHPAPTNAACVRPILGLPPHDVAFTMSNNRFAQRLASLAAKPIYSK